MKFVLQNVVGIRLLLGLSKFYFYLLVGFLFIPYLWILSIYSPQMWEADIEMICAIERI